MNDDGRQTIQITFDKEAMEMLEACAAWRKVPVAELVCTYVEDWLDIDYPESQGRRTRRGLYRDGPLGLDPYTQQVTSQNWRKEFGVGPARDRRAG